MKELFEYIGYSPEDGAEPKWDDVKKALNEKFVPINQLKERTDLIKPLIDEAYGKKARKTQVDIVKVMKENGLDAAHSEFEKIPTIDELLPIVVKKFKTQIEEKAAKDKTGDETLKQQLEDVKNESKRFKGLYEDLDKEHKTLKENSSKELAQSKIKQFKDGLYSKVNWRKNIPELEKNGFKTKFDETYDVKVTDEGNFELKDKEGKTVYHPNKPTQPLTPEEAMKLFAKENKVDDAAPYEGQKPNRKDTSERKETKPDDEGKPARKANPRFFKNRQD